MYKKLTFFIAGCLLTVATVFANVQVNETNFPDPGFRAWILAQPWGSDGEITNAEIAGITEMELLGVDVRIFDLTGINFFTNLRHLHTGAHPLASLDVSGLSNLEYLYHEDNAGTNIYGISLTSLNVSGLTNLKKLYVASSFLTSLDLSGLTNLQQVYVFSAEGLLNSINLSGLVNLEKLYMGGNQLTSINVSDLKNLQELCLGNNRLTSIDVSGLTNLQELNLIANQLTSIDLTGLENLRVFSGTAQTPTFTLTGANNNYSLAIALNNPIFSASGLSFANGILTSTSNEINSSFFQVQAIGIPSFVLNGTLTLNYETRITTPTENGVVIEWAHIDGVYYWILAIYADAERTQEIRHIRMDAQGNIISAAPYSRNGGQMLSYTVTGLASETQFFYSLTALDGENEVISVSLGNFTTLESGVTVNIPEINLNRTPVAFYTITGVRLGQKPQSGIFIILYCDGSAERVMR